MMPITNYGDDEAPMFGWLKRLKGEAGARPMLTEEALEDMMRGRVMKGLTKAHCLEPEYREDVTSEEDFEARSSSLPLIVVWNEHQTSEGLAFSMSVNKHLVEQMTERFMERHGSLFPSVRNQIVEDLRTSSFSAMMKACEATGAPPSVICHS